MATVEAAVEGSGPVTTNFSETDCGSAPRPLHCIAALQAGKTGSLDDTFIVANTNDKSAKQTGTSSKPFPGKPTGMLLPWDQCPNPVDYVSTRDRTLVFDTRLSFIPKWPWSTKIKTKPIGVHQFQLGCKPEKNALWERVAISPYL